MEISENPRKGSLVWLADSLVCREIGFTSFSNKNGNVNSHAPFLVDEKERLDGGLVFSLNPDGEGRETDEAPVPHVPPRGEVRVPMPVAVDVGLAGFIPLGQRLVERDVKPAHAALVSHRVAVVEADGVAVDTQVGVVAVLDDEPNPLFVPKDFGEVVVHHPLKRVAPLTPDVNLLGDSGVVAAGTGDGEYQFRIGEDVADARFQQVRREEHGVDRKQGAVLRKLLVDVAGDEVTAKPQHEVLDGHVLLFLLDHANDAVKEGSSAGAGDRNAVVVASVDGLGADALFDVPVGSENDSGSLRIVLAQRRLDVEQGRTMLIEGFLGAEFGQDLLVLAVKLVVQASQVFLSTPCPSRGTVRFRLVREGDGFVGHWPSPFLRAVCTARNSRVDTYTGGQGVSLFRTVDM